LGIAGVGLGKGVAGSVGVATGRALGVAGSKSVGLGETIGATVGSDATGSDAFGTDADGTAVAAGLIAMQPTTSSPNTMGRDQGSRMTAPFSLVEHGNRTNTEVACLLQVMCQD
jgi:hypothetical protein